MEKESNLRTELLGLGMKMITNRNQEYKGIPEIIIEEALDIAISSLVYWITNEEGGEMTLGLDYNENLKEIIDNRVAIFRFQKVYGNQSKIPENLDKFKYKRIYNEVIVLRN